MPGYPPPYIKIKLNGKVLRPVPHIKYLGIYIDACLNFSYQTLNTLKKLNRANGMLSKARHYVDKNVIKNLYHSLFASHLLYGAQIWGQSKNTHTKRLFTAQNKALRIISFSDFRASQNPLYSNLEIIKLSDAIKTMNVIFVKKCLDKETPACFHSMFKPILDVHTHDKTLSGSGGIFTSNYITFRFGIKSIAAFCVRDWNKLIIKCPIDLLKCPTVTLKKELYEYFRKT